MAEIVIYFLLSVFLIIILSILNILIFLFILEVYYNLFRKITPFVPTSIRKHKSEFEELFSFLNDLDLKNKKFIDLGSGDGELVRIFAERGYESYGVEINPILILFSRWKTRKYKNVNFIKNDFYKINLKDFGIVYVYQLSSVNKNLMSKFTNELQKGALIISHKFALPYNEKIKLIKTVGNWDFLIYQKII